MERTRFAPSPTGELHIGSARTALFSYLLAKQSGGQFVVRIEDTDRQRFVKGSEQRILEGLRWLGLEPDEAPDGGGPYGPYRQSERLDIYRRYTRQLIEKNCAYYCFCTAERLDSLRKKQMREKQPPRYDRRCASLSLEEVIERVKRGEPYVVRLCMPQDGEMTFHDEVRGSIRFAYKELDDHVVLKSDGFPTYHLASVVDDKLMRITLVTRTEEWLPSLPRHVWLFQCLGWKPPRYAHLPLVLNEKKEKLSKREHSNDVWLLSYRNKGYLPEALVNYLAFLGWNPKTDREYFTLQELKEHFRLDHIHVSGAIWKKEKLNWFNAYYLRKKTVKQLAELCLPYLQKAVWYSKQYPLGREYIERIAALEQERMTTLSDITEGTSFFFEQELSYPSKLLIWKQATREGTIQALDFLEGMLQQWVGDWTKENLERGILTRINAEGRRNGDVLWPFRVALTGLEKSPSPFDIAAILGKEQTLARLRHAREVLALSSER